APEVKQVVTTTDSWRRVPLGVIDHNSVVSAQTKTETAPDEAVLHVVQPAAPKTLTTSPELLLHPKKTSNTSNTSERRTSKMSRKEDVAPARTSRPAMKTGSSQELRRTTVVPNFSASENEVKHQGHLHLVQDNSATSSLRQPFLKNSRKSDGLKNKENLNHDILVEQDQDDQIECVLNNNKNRWAASTTKTSP
ncbi:unnamed protein product, partial [Amoebophrya sp. A120]